MNFKWFNAEYIYLGVVKSEKNFFKMAGDVI